VDADLEQQEDRAELAEEVQRFVVSDHSEQRRAEDRTDRDLEQHGRQLETFGDLRRETRREQQREEPEEEFHAT
jgi:hypothetical protein